MDILLMLLPWIFGSIVGFTVFYFVIRAAVRDGTVEAAEKIRKKADQ